MPSFTRFGVTYTVPTLPEDVSADWMAENYDVLDAVGHRTVPSDHVLKDLINATMIAQDVVGITPTVDLNRATDVTEEYLDDIHAALRLDAIGTQILTFLGTAAGLAFATVATGGLTAGATVLALANAAASMTDTQKKYLTSILLVQRANSFIDAANEAAQKALIAFEAAYADPLALDVAQLLLFEEEYNRASLLLKHAIGATEMTHNAALDAGLDPIAPPDANDWSNTLIVAGSALGTLGDSYFSGSFGVPASFTALKTAGNFATVVQLTNTLFFSDTDENRTALEQQLEQMPTVDSVNAEYETLIAVDADNALQELVDAVQINGTVENDYISPSEAYGVFAFGDAGNDTIHGSNGPDRLLGGEDDDSLLGGDGHDVINGGTGNNTIDAGEGDDVVYVGDGLDEVIDPGGNDVYHVQGFGDVKIRDTVGTNGLTLPGSILSYDVSLVGADLLITSPDRLIELLDFDPVHWKIGGFDESEFANAIARDVDGAALDFSIAVTPHTNDGPVENADLVSYERIDLNSGRGGILTQNTSAPSYSDTLVGLWRVTVDETTNPEGDLAVRLSGPNSLFDGPAIRFLTISLYDADGAKLAQDAALHLRYDDWLVDLPEIKHSGLAGGDYYIAVDYAGDADLIDGIDLWTWQGTTPPPDTGGEDSTFKSDLGAVGLDLTRTDQILIYEQYDNPLEYYPSLAFHDLADGTTEYPAASVSIEAHGGVQLGDYYYFEGSSEAFGDEIYATNGTAEGTGVVFDAAIGSEDSTVELLGELNDKLLMGTPDVGSLLAYDSTTGLITDLAAISDAERIVISDGPFYAGGHAYFEVYIDPSLTEQGDDGYVIWRTDGTLAGTTQLLEPGSFGAFPQDPETSPDGQSLFWYELSGRSYNLFSIEASAPDTVQSLGLLFESPAEGATVYFRNLVPTNTGVLFTLLSDTDSRVVHQDMESGQQTIVASSSPGVAFDLESVGSQIHVVETLADGSKRLHAADSETGALEDLSADATGGLGKILERDDDRIVFSSGDGLELWLTDGTAAGTQLIIQNTWYSAISWDQADLSGDVAYASYNSAGFFTIDIESNDYSFVRGPAPYFEGASTSPVYGVGGVTAALPDGGLAFLARDGKYALWKTEGTVEGTESLPGFDILGDYQLPNPRPILLNFADRPIDPPTGPGPISYIADNTVGEGQSIDIVFQRPLDLVGEVVISWQAGGRGEIPLTSGTSTIAAGENTTVLSLMAPDDAVSNALPETVPFLITAATAGSSPAEFDSSVHIVYVLDNDQTPYVSVTDAAYDEATDLAFQVSVDRPMLTDVILHYDVTPITAEQDDFAEDLRSSVLIKAGATAAEIRIPIIDDTVLESNELIRLRLLYVEGANARVQNDAVSGTIIDNDQPAVETGGPVVLEGGLLPVYFGDGNDSIVAGVAGNEIRTSGGNDTVTGGDGDDRLFGGAQSDFLSGHAGDDWIDGGTGVDSLFGGEGNDTIVVDHPDDVSGDSSTSLDDTDTLLTNQDVGPFELWAENIIHSGIESATILASDRPNRITGGLGDLYVDGGDGDDTITTFDGADNLRGGAGDDHIHAGAGDDLVLGGDGHDWLHSGLGYDDIIGGAGNDTLVAGVGDSAQGDEGNNEFLVTVGPSERTWIVANGEQDTVRINGWTRDADNNALITLFAPGPLGDRLDLSEVLLELETLGLWDGISNPFEAGPLEILRDGLDSVLTADFGNGPVTLLRFWRLNAGELTSENFVPALEFDANTSPEGTPFVVGSSVVGQTLIADTSAIRDADGLGVFSYQWLRDGIVVTGATSDSYLLSLADVDAQMNVEVSYVDGNGISELVTSPVSTPIAPLDMILVGTPGDDVLDGGIANDQIDGLDGNDILRGNEGNDTLLGGDGADTLNGLDGDDEIFGGSTSADLRDVVYAGEGNDSVDGGYGNDNLYGGGGNDTIAGSFGADTVIGNDGDDVLTGSAYSDQIFGNDGFDFINGGFGSDRVNGGAGADRFFHIGTLGHGSDWIQDYSAAEGDLLVYGGAAGPANFQVNITNTAGAGDAGVDEAFVIWKPTGQILWALVDGGGQDEINLRLGGGEYDLLA